MNAGQDYRVIVVDDEPLDSTRFVRVHRSAIVRVEAIREIHPLARGDQELVLEDGTSVSVSRRFRARLDELLAS